MSAESGGGLVVRPVVRGDATVLFRWLNAADRIATSFQTSGPVAWEDHVAWLDRHLADAGHWHAIALYGGQPAGQVRIERIGGNPVISIYVDVDFRKLGVGRRMIDAASETARQRWPGQPLLAQIRNDNPGSVAFFERNGFSEVDRRADRIILRRFP